MLSGETGSDRRLNFILRRAGAYTSLGEDGNIGSAAQNDRLIKAAVIVIAVWRFALKSPARTLPLSGQTATADPAVLHTVAKGSFIEPQLRWQGRGIQSVSLKPQVSGN